MDMIKNYIKKIFNLFNSMKLYREFKKTTEKKKDLQKIVKNLKRKTKQVKQEEKMSVFNKNVFDVLKGKYSAEIETRHSEYDDIDENMR